MIYDDTISTLNTFDTYVLIMQGSAYLEDLQTWPARVPPPVVSDRLGTSLTVKTHKIPEAQYAFEWVKAKLLKAPWRNASSSGLVDESGM